MSVGLATGAGVGAVTSCAKTTVVAPKKAAINRTTDEATRFVEVKAFIALDSTGRRPERQSQRRKKLCSGLSIALMGQKIVALGAIMGYGR
jgi:hypothetical protein